MNSKMLRIYVSNTDVVKGESVYEKIVRDAKHFGLMGATTYKAVMGYGLSSNLSFNKFWEMNSKVPIVVEIVDEENKIKAFLEQEKVWIDQMPKGCLITLQDVEILLQKKGTK
jgi:PII-like signaling protein